MTRSEAGGPVHLPMAALDQTMDPTENLECTEDSLGSTPPHWNWFRDCGTKESGLRSEMASSSSSSNSTCDVESLLHHQLFNKHSKSMPALLAPTSSMHPLEELLQHVDVLSNDDEAGSPYPVEDLEALFPVCEEQTLEPIEPGALVGVAAAAPAASFESLNDEPNEVSTLPLDGNPALLFDALFPGFCNPTSHDRTKDLQYCRETSDVDQLYPGASQTQLHRVGHLRRFHKLRRASSMSAIPHGGFPRNLPVICESAAPHHPWAPYGKPRHHPPPPPPLNSTMHPPTVGPECSNQPMPEPISFFAAKPGPAIFAPHQFNTEGCAVCFDEQVDHDGPFNAEMSMPPPVQAELAVLTTLSDKYWKNGRKNLQCFPSCPEHHDFFSMKMNNRKHSSVGVCRGPIYCQLVCPRGSSSTINHGPGTKDDASTALQDVFVMGRFERVFRNEHITSYEQFEPLPMTIASVHEFESFRRNCYQAVELEDKRFTQMRREPATSTSCKGSQVKMEPPGHPHHGEHEVVASTWVFLPDVWKVQPALKKKRKATRSLPEQTFPFCFRVFAYKKTRLSDAGGAPNSRHTPPLPSSSASPPNNNNNDNNNLNNSGDWSSATDAVQFDCIASCRSPLFELYSTRTVDRVKRKQLTASTLGLRQKSM